MSGGAANEAQVVISTDFTTMKDFVEFTKRGLDDVKDKGKSSFREIGKEVTDFTKSIVGGTIVAAGTELATAITAPLRKGFGEAIKDAESFRRTITQVAISAGQDIGKVGKELEGLSLETRRSVEEINAFVQGVKGQTGDRKGAIAAAKGASMEARARGVDLGDLTGEVGTLQRRWGIADVNRFYNEQRAGAKAVGANPNQAMSLFGKMLPMLEATGMSAEKAGQFSTSLMNMAGGDMSLALKAGQEFTGLVQDREARGYLERTLGLKQGGLLDDKFRPDVAKALDLMQRFQKSKRGQKGLEFVARQHMSGPTAAMFSRGMDRMRSDMDVQTRVSAGQDLESVEAADAASDQGKADLAEQERRRKDRQMGGDLLPWYDKVREHAGGWGGAALGFLTGGAGLAGARRLAVGMGRQIVQNAPHQLVGRAASGAGALGSGILGRAAGWLGRAGGVASLAMTSGDTDAETLGAQRARMSESNRNFLMGELEKPGNSPERRQALLSNLAQLDPRQAAEIQAKANADHLSKGSAIPVRLVGMSMAPTTGEGSQK